MGAAGRGEAGKIGGPAEPGSCGPARKSRVNSPGPCCSVARTGGANGGSDSGATEGGAGGFSAVSGARNSLVNSPGPSGREGWSGLGGVTRAASALGAGPAGIAFDPSALKKIRVKSPGASFPGLCAGGEGRRGLSAVGCTGLRGCGLRLSKAASMPGGEEPSGGFSAFEAGAALGFSGRGETGPGAFGMGMSLPKKTFVNSPGSSFALEGGGVPAGGLTTFGWLLSRAVSSEAGLSCPGCGDDPLDPLLALESRLGADLGAVVSPAVFAMPPTDRSHSRRS